jgi:PhnB protein
MPESFELLDQAIDALLAGAPPVQFNAHSDVELTPLVEIASALTRMPEEHFQSRLRDELERRASMSNMGSNMGSNIGTAAATKSVREGFHTVTPFIAVSEPEKLIALLKHAFNAEETGRSPKDHDFHVEVRVGDSMLMIHDCAPGGEKIGAFHVYLPDSDAAYTRALEAGATGMGAPEDRPYGERQGTVKDLAGNLWYIATRFPSTEAPEGAGSVMPYVHPAKARVFIDFVTRAFDGKEMAVYEDAQGRVMHAAVRIGDSLIEMGEAPNQTQSNGFFLYVDDCDAWYRRALAAGAISLIEPADQPYGRAAAIRDPFGYQWGLCSLPAR